MKLDDLDDFVRQEKEEEQDDIDDSDAEDKVPEKEGPSFFQYMPLEDLMQESGVDRPLSFANSFERIAQHIKDKKEGTDSQKMAVLGAVKIIKEQQKAANDDSDEGGSGLGEKLERKLENKIGKFFVKQLRKFIVKSIKNAIFRAVRWTIKEIIFRGITLAIDFIIEPVLTAVLGFLGVNIELWPFIAILGGAAAVGYTLFQKFFSGTDKEGPKEKPPKEQTETVAEKGNNIVKAPEVKEEAKPQVPETKTEPVRAAPPIAAGAPVAAKAATAPTPSGGASDKKVKDNVIRHEGVKTRPYKDSLGLWTVGVGHLIGDGKSLPDEYNREFTMEEVMALFDKDFDVHAQAAHKIPNFDKLNAEGQGALIDMTFNMGPTWFNKWPKLMAALRAFDIQAVVDNLKGSTWYKQVKGRAVENVNLIATNLDSTKDSSQGLQMAEATTQPAPVRTAQDVNKQPGVMGQQIAYPRQTTEIVKTSTGVPLKLAA